MTDAPMEFLALATSLLFLAFLYAVGLRDVALALGVFVVVLIGEHFVGLIKLLDIPNAIVVSGIGIYMFAAMWRRWFKTVHQ
jgi:hypothetical protein